MEDHVRGAFLILAAVLALLFAVLLGAFIGLLATFIR